MNNKHYLPKLITLAAIILTLIACEREYNNPWDEKANLDPSAWAPQNLQIEDISITEKKLTWAYTADERIEGFKLDRKKGDEEWQVAYNTFDKETCDWIDADIVPDPELTYSYRLYAYAGQYNSAQKNSNASAAIPAPSNLQTEKLTDKSYKLTWTDNSIGEEGFKIDRKVNNDSWQAAYGTVNENQATFIDTNVFVKSGMAINVEYRVYSFLQSYESAIVSVSTNAELMAPTNLEITVNSITSVTLTWQYNSTGEEGFKIERKVNEGTWDVEFATLNANQTTFTDESLDLENNVYTYRVYAYINTYQSQKIEANITLEIGAHIGGGIIFYFDGSGGGLVCAESNQINAEWGCYDTSIGETETTVGTGAANTAAIVAGCSETGIAAKICDELVLNSYDDWFLPSKDELNLMYVNLKQAGIGGFAGDYYWSSSEYNSNLAWIQRFANGNQHYGSKGNSLRVRAVRAF